MRFPGIIPAVTTPFDAHTGEVDTRALARNLEALLEAGVPAGPINTVAEALTDPHILAREMVVTLAHPTAGSVSVTGVPAKFSATPGAVRSAPPLLGQHTDEVLRSLGYDHEGIAKLRADGTI